MEELKNIPEDVHITDIFEHVTPPQLAATPELRKKLIQHYRDERLKFTEEKKKGKKAKVKADAKKVENLLDAKATDG